MPTTALHEVLRLGVQQSASDWHIKPNAPIMIRVAGKLVPTTSVPNEAFMDEIVEELLNPAQLETFYQVGDCDLSFYEDNVGRFRVNIHFQRGMKCINMRHVKSHIIPLHKLGVPPVLKDIAESHRGIIIMTGTTGSGKSTTWLVCYSMLMKLSQSILSLLRILLSMNFKIVSPFLNKEKLVLIQNHFLQH